jgi:hypothetical protein
MGLARAVIAQYINDIENLFRVHSGKAAAPGADDDVLGLSS